MDVQCERCKTEYEFDDALVSGRGTTVRCTNCGHQFKVRRSEPGAAGNDGANDRWVVHTAGGNELTFLTLRELQRAILIHQVGRADMLVRGNTPPRALGSIAELEPFFEGRTSSRPPPGSQSPSADLKRTHSWGAPPISAAPLPPPRPKIDTLRPPLHSGAPPPPPSLALSPTMSAAGSLMAAAAPSMSAPAPPHHAASSFAPAAPPPPPPPPPLALAATAHATMPTASPPPPVVAPPTAPNVAGYQAPANPAVSPVAQSVEVQPQPSGLPPPTGVRRSSMPSYDPTPDPPSVFPDDAPYSMSRRRGVGGWIVAVVLLGAVGVVTWVVAKPYLAAHAEAPAAQLDPRASSFLGEGEKAMGDGNLDLAQEAFDKASALAEHDPRVLLDEARVAAAKADVPWLKLRLLPPDRSEEARMTKSQLDERLARVRKASDDALSAAPSDPAACRTKIDALRLTGDRDMARTLVAKVISQASQPETAYVLAALDLSEPEPLWGTVIERLRTAAVAEGSAGRARAALVYALARSGDVAGAKAELARLDAQLRPYPLLPNLHELVDKAGAKPVADAGAAPRVVDVNALPQQAPGIAAGGGGGGGGGGGSVGGGGRGDEGSEAQTGSMGAAAAAIHKGDWSRARQIYEAIVTKNPSDSEALAGLGDVARAQGDNAGAVTLYKRALAVNPSYLPALLGVADTEFAMGNQAAAQRAYKDIVDRFPEGTYPDRAKARAEPAPAAAASTATPSSAKASASSESP
jgi:predicted Zn finger-like uncharacterized protein